MIETTRNANSSRIVELDAIRGLAALAVMIFHWKREFWFGSTGVDLFFVLSGFLISDIILQNCRRERFLRTFYLRRALRILPIYYLVVIAVFVVNACLSHPKSTIGYSYFLFYLQNTSHYWGSVPASTELPLAHTWTLAIEEQFYLLWPVVVLFLSPRRLLALCVCLALFSGIARYEGLNAETLFGRLDGLALGTILACVRYRWPSLKGQSAAAGFFALAACAGASYFILWNQCAAQSLDLAKSFRGNAGISLISLAYFGLIGGVCIVAGSRGTALLRMRWLTGLGTISYGLYLYHVVVYAAVDDYVKAHSGYDNSYLIGALKIGISVAIACLSWRFIEKPLLGFKDRIVYGDKLPETTKADSDDWPVVERRSGLLALPRYVGRRLYTVFDGSRRTSSPRQ
jgi:peptidoglycan/LPS O-acetylase OafA/YrhL